MRHASRRGGRGGTGRGGGRPYEPADGPREERTCGAVAVPAAADPAAEGAGRNRGPYDGPGDPGGGAIRLGDLPVGRCGMVLGGACALDPSVGPAADPIDGPADVEHGGSTRTRPKYEGQGPYGRLPWPKPTSSPAGFGTGFRKGPAAGWWSPWTRAPASTRWSGQA